MIRILYFGQLAEITGLLEERLELHTDVRALKEALYKKYPVLSLKQFIVSVNKCVVQNTPLNENDEVALMPPFSGG